MCRFVAYFGKKKSLLSDIIKKPKNSLICQSREAREGAKGINADGFGIAWYKPEIDKTPGIFKSTQPAWNDENLIHIATKIQSPCFLAHVRASTIGDVNLNNCHPFNFAEYSMVHNGTIRGFDKYKRKIINDLDEDLFLKIKGNTDSEHFFYIIMQHIRNGNTFEEAVMKSIQYVIDLQKNDHQDTFSRLNICITNHNEIIATRFVSKGHESLSLHYKVNQEKSDHHSLIISSEQLDKIEDRSWEVVPNNSYIYVNRKNMDVKIKK